MRYPILFLLITISLTACVSKKKHNEVLSSMKSGYTAQLQHTSDSLQRLLTSTRNREERLELDLAERKGENNILLLMQDKYEAKISQLESEITMLSDQSQSSMQGLNEMLREKNQEIKSLRDILIAIDKLLEGNEKGLTKLADEMRFELQLYDAKNYAVDVQRDQVKVVLFEEFVFKKGSASRLEPKAIEAIGKLAAVLQAYPLLSISVVGHTDNSSPPISYKTNWLYSALRAATIAELMTEEFGVNSSQLIAAGRGAFQPRTSNETVQGRAENRRIELLLTWRSEDVARAVRQKFSGVK